MVGRDVGLEIWTSAGAFVNRASRLLHASLEWPLNAVPSFSVELPVTDPAILDVTIGRVVKLTATEGILCTGTVRGIAGLRVQDARPAMSLQFLCDLDDLNQVEVMRRWWHDATRVSTILGASTGSPPGLLYNTGWTPSIDVAVGNRLREVEFLWGPLLRAIIRGIDLAGAAWWADPITDTLYVGTFGTDSGIVLARPDAQGPDGATDSTVLWPVRISKTTIGPKANRLFAIGGDSGDDRVILPTSEPAGASYVVVEVPGNMTDQTERYIQDAASQTLYGVIEASIINREIDTENFTMEEAQRWLYWLAEKTLVSWKDAVTKYDITVANHAISHVGRSTITPGSKVRLFYNGYVEQTHPVTGERMGVQYETINALYYVTDILREWSGDAETLRLQLASSLQITAALPIGPGPGAGAAETNALGASQAMAAKLQTRGFTGTFTILPDVPDSYTGEAANVLVCNTGETALEFDDRIVTLALSIPGILSVETQPARFQVKDNLEILLCYATLGTAASSGATTFDVLLGGTSIWASTPANRISVAQGDQAADGGAPDTTTVSAGDYFQVDTAAVGTGAADAVVHIRCRRR